MLGPAPTNPSRLRCSSVPSPLLRSGRWPQWPCSWSGSALGCGLGRAQSSEVPAPRSRSSGVIPAHSTHPQARLGRRHMNVEPSGPRAFRHAFVVVECQLEQFALGHLKLLQVVSGVVEPLPVADGVLGHARRFEVVRLTAGGSRWWPAVQLSTSEVAPKLWTRVMQLVAGGPTSTRSGWD